MSQSKTIQNVGISKLPFWDVDFKSLHPEGDCLFILEKVFNYCFWADYKAVLDYSEQVIAGGIFPMADTQFELYQQITPALEWDIKNNKGIHVASGVYIIHINAYGMGERTIKWFGVTRTFEPSGLQIYRSVGVTPVYIAKLTILKTGVTLTMRKV